MLEQRLPFPLKPTLVKLRPTTFVRLRPATLVKLRPALLAASVAATCPSMVMAQTIPSDSEELSTVTVVGDAATKTETPFLETPQATSTVSFEEYDQRGARTVQRALNYTPGVYTNQIGASNRYDYIVLRGFS